MNNDLGRMVLIQMLSFVLRGVMEKCSMCIQMTQKTILMLNVMVEQLKMENLRPLVLQLVILERLFW